MVRLKFWQWMVLALPIVSIISFVLIAAGIQIQAWGLSWIWALLILVFVGWRWLLVHWTRPLITQVEAVVAEVNQELEVSRADKTALLPDSDPTRQAEAILHHLLVSAQADLPIWEDWPTFWQRCQYLVREIAHLYHPEVKYPLLNIYVPQAATLLRGTVDDLAQWLHKLSPVLNQVTLGQAVQTYEVYRQLEPSARKLWQVWNWAQWLLNPAAALARQVSQRSGNQANQQLLVNLSQLLREAALRNLCRQAIGLYSGTTLPPSLASPAPPPAKTQTLQTILAQAEPSDEIGPQPVQILLVGRTGAGKSSLINTLFQSEQAAVDVLPNTDQIQSYRWQVSSGQELVLWDTPGYQPLNRPDLQEQVLDHLTQADVLLLATPALDPALQMDIDFLQKLRAQVADLPTIVIVTQVDRLRPMREWQPPYDWQWGDRPKEVAIREATQYRIQQLGDWCDRVLPLVAADGTTGRIAWGDDVLAATLIEVMDPARQIRLARFLRDREARAIAAAQIIDHYTFQMTTTQGLTAFLKSPVLQFLSTLITGSPSLAYLLAEQIPMEQLPIVIGKLQMAYDLFSLLSPDGSNPGSFDLLSLWPLLLENPEPPDRNAWAFGHALVEYWTQQLTVGQLQARFEDYLRQS
ncbi:GTPase [Leptolyngbya sp. 'hensonii']|uniref:GTPase family protein n=1 Tax=Leptolyngbya sp. 'hensonii' TaxID=1922337 RepID=UPI0009500E76|nr:GTPase [Leptolyngbya sp. 'hensonii']OLP17209.1 GTPase [Leptolyngbya sp. 'hensonii']